MKIKGTFTDPAAGYFEDLGYHEVPDAASVVWLFNTWQQRLQECPDNSNPTIWVTLCTDRVIECCADSWGLTVLKQFPSEANPCAADESLAPMLLIALMNREICTTYDVKDETGGRKIQGNIDTVVEVMARMGLGKDLEDEPGRFDIEITDTDEFQ